MRHAGAKASGVVRSLNTLSDEERLNLATRGNLLQGRVGERRDFCLEARRSQLYEELRLLNKDQLFERAGVQPGPGWAKQQLVTEIMKRELPR